MITVITATGDREIAFGLCRKWMQAQTILPDQWIIVDDGKNPIIISKPEDYVYYIRREPGKNEGHTLLLNLKESLSHIKGDKILIIEDDDWYGPEYVKTMSGYLDKYDLVGEAPSRYYHVPTMKYRRVGNTKHASLCQTGFNRILLQKFEEYLIGDPYLDVRFWEGIKEKKYLFSDIGDKLHLHCGMKGLKGRKGIGTGHNSKANYYYPDNHLAFLIKWVGEEDAKVYMDHVGQSFESAKLISFGSSKNSPKPRIGDKSRIGDKLPKETAPESKRSRKIVGPKNPVVPLHLRPKRAHPNLRPVKTGGDFPCSKAIGPDGKRIMPKNWR